MQLCLVSKRYFCALFVLLLLFASSTLAQIGTASIRGTVSDKTGGVVAGATVKLSSAALSVQRTTTSGDTGQYEFVSLKPGDYVLSVEAPGFRKYEQKNVELLVNNPTTLNISLQVGATSETVEVSAQTVTLNTTDASVGVAFDENQVKQLPLESCNVTLDGISVNPKGGYAFQSVLPVTPDSVEEFRVTTSNADADQGVAGGAQVALVTKSGTNQFHGSAYEYNRNSYLSANDVQSAAATNPAGTLFNGNGQTLGNYTGLITNPRIMQFALRYEF